MIVIEDILGRCAPLLGVDAGGAAAPQLLRARPDRRRTGSRCGTPSGWRDIWSILLRAQRLRRAARPRSPRSTPRTRTPSAALAMTPVKFGISFNLTAFNQAGALVHVYKDGSVLINHGGTEMGQGLHTKMIQVAATALGVPLSCVRLAPTRTDKVPNTSATAASSGRRPQRRRGQERLRPDPRAAGDVVAAGKLGIHPDDVRFVDGVVTGIGFHDKQIAWAELVHDAYFQRVQLWAAGFYRTAGLHWDADRMQGEPFKYFAYGAAVSEVEVDGFTGAYRLRRVDIVHDVGDSLSPLIDLGQIEGGFVQGAGWLTLEELRWDDERRAAPRPAEHPGGEHLQDPELLRDAGGVQRAPVRAGHRVRRGLRLQGGRRAAADAGVQRPRGAAAGGRRVRAGRAGRSTWAARRPRRPCTGRSRPPGAAAGCRPTAPSRRPAPRRSAGVLSMDWLERGRSSCGGGSARRAGHGDRGPRARARATPAPRWSSAPTRPGAASAAATSRRPRSRRARELIESGAAGAGDAGVAAQRARPQRARPAVLRRRGHAAARAAAGPADGRGLRRRARRLRAGPDPVPAGGPAAPGRLPRRRSSTRCGWPT